MTHTPTDDQGIAHADVHVWVRASMCSPGVHECKQAVSLTPTGNLYSYWQYGYGLYSYDLHRYGLDSYGSCVQVVSLNPKPSNMPI